MLVPPRLLAIALEDMGGVKRCEHDHMGTTRCFLTTLGLRRRCLASQ